MKTRKSIRSVLALLLAVMMIGGGLQTTLAFYSTGESVTLPDGGTYIVSDFLHEGDFDVYYLNSEGTRRTTTPTESTYGVSIRRIREDQLLRSAANLYIPDTYCGYPVLRLEKADDRNHYIGIRIPASVREIADPLFSNCPYLEWIEVDEGNPYFYSVDGALYSGNIHFDATHLVCYPQGKKDESFTTFAGALCMERKAFCGNPYLKTLTIAAGEEGFGLYTDAICDCANLETVIFGEGVHLSDLSANAIRSCPNLSTVHLPNSVVGFADSFSLDFLNSTGAAALTVCYPYESLLIKKAANALGFGCRVCGLEHFYATVEEPQMPGQPIPEPEELTDESLFAFRTIYACDEAGNYVTDSEGSLIAIGLCLYGAYRRIGTPVRVTIPSSFGGLPVLEIADGFSTYFGNMVSVSIPSTVQRIEDEALCCPTLQQITVDADNTTYKSVDGVLFTADGKTLAAYPNARAAEVYEIPEGTERLAGERVFFDWTCGLRQLYLPQSFTDANISENTIGLTCLERFIVSADNSVFFADEAGVLYNKEQTALIRYPACGPLLYTLPQSVTAIAYYALTNMDDGITICVSDGATQTPVACLTYACATKSSESRICFHIPQSVTSIRYSAPSASCCICCETSASQAAAFAKANKMRFFICDEEHTCVREMTENDPPVPELNGDEGIFEYSIMSEADAFGVAQSAGVCIHSLRQTPDEPFALTIPDEYCGLPVRAVSLSGSWTHEHGAKLTSIHLPASVQTIQGINTYCTVLSSVTVDAANLYLRDVDGVVYDKALSTLIVYPPGKQDASYTVPDGVATLNSGAMNRNPHVQHITLPASFMCEQALLYNTLRTLSDLTSVTVDPDNPVFSSDDGVLFNADKTVLILYPRAAERECYTIPGSVLEIFASAAFYQPKHLRILCVAQGAARTPMGVVATTDLLQYVHIPSSVTDVRWHVGLRQTICSETADCAAAVYAKKNGNAFALCSADHAQFTPVDPEGLPDEPIDPPDEPNDPPQSPDAPLMLAVCGCSAKRGETVQVTVQLTKNTGIIATRLHLTYDADVLWLTDVQDGGLLGTGTFVAGNDLSAMPYTVLWDDARTRVNHTETGTLVTYTFRVASDAPLGETAITVVYDEDSTFDVDLENVAYSIENGSVLIHDRTPGDTNGNGYLDLKDVVLLHRFLAGGWDVTIRTDNADVNGDGVLSLKDCTLISRFLAGGWDVTLR